jgi:hypothetical protein
MPSKIRSLLTAGFRSRSGSARSLDSLQKRCRTPTRRPNAELRRREHLHRGRATHGSGQGQPVGHRDYGSRRTSEYGNGGRVPVLRLSTAFGAYWPRMMSSHFCTSLLCLKFAPFPVPEAAKNSLRSIT